MQEEMASDPMTGFPGNAQIASVEQREAARFTPMMRSAKLVGRDGEVLCVVRDVSENGVSVRLFHPVTGMKGLALEMADGTRHGLVPVWERGDRAGFRFAGDVDLPTLIAGVDDRPRRPLRLRVIFGATLICIRGRFEGEVRNLSQQGANVTCDAKLAIDQRVRISSDQLPEVEARVRWRHEDTYGLVFDDVLSYPQLARIAAEVQGMESAFPEGTAYSCEAG